MTRETKIGLVVAGSFLCLVAVVVASKLRRSDTPPGSDEEQTVKVAAAKPLQGVGDPKPEPRKPEVTPVFPPPAPTVERTNPLPPVPPPVVVPSQQSPPVSPPPPFPPPVSAPPLPPVSVPPLPPVSTPPPLKEFKEFQPLAFDVKPGAEKDKPPAIPVPPTIQVTPVIPLPPDKKEITFPALPEPKKENKPPFVMGPVEDKKLDIPVPPLTDKSGPPIPPVGGGVTFPPPNPPPPMVVSPPKNDVPPGLVFPQKKDDVTTTPPIIAFPPKIDPLPPIGVSPPKKDAPSIGGVTFPPLQPPEVTPPISVATPKKDDAPPLPPVGGFAFPALKDPPKKDPPGAIPPPPVINIGPITPSVPPIGIGGPPRVTSFNPEFTQFKPGELTFGDLSRRVYQTDKYAAALLEYNRDHRNLIKNGGVFGVSPPLLSVGQEVMYPPKELLERDYAKLIAGLTPPIGISPPPVGIAPPVRITPPVALDPGVSPASAPLNNSGSYVVQGQGERIRDIARRVLGNPDRWTDIYNLNRNIQPQFPIPPGTQLKLPTN